MQHTNPNSRLSFERLIRKLSAKKYLRRTDITGDVSIDLDSLTAAITTQRAAYTFCK